MSTNKVERQMRDLAEECGITDITIETGGRHRKLRGVSPKGFHVFMPFSPDCMDTRRGVLNMRARFRQQCNGIYFNK